MTSLDFIKFATMHPLQERVAELGTCPNCHVKSLRALGLVAETEWFQCRRCSHVFVLPDRRLTG